MSFVLFMFQLLSCISILVLAGLAADTISTESLTSSSSSTTDDFTTWTTTISANSSGGIYYIPRFYDRIQTYNVSTITAASTFPVTPTAADGSSIETFPLSDTSITTLTVENGPLTFLALETFGFPSFINFTTVAITGPTTWTGTASAPGDWQFKQGAGRGHEVYMFKAAYTEGCDAIITNVFTDDISSMIDAHVVSRKSPIATVTAGQTLTTTLSERVNFTTNFVVRTFTGPQTVYTTTSNSLVGQWFTDGHMGPAAPGYRCSGKCFECQLFFFTVSVFYWPTGPVNTDCLDAISSTTMAGTLLSRGVKVEARSLTGMAPDATTFITNGFTFTSPSAYVGFPVISAVDRCGTIGSVHTSATLAYAPEDLSTGLLTQETTKLTTQFITHTSKEGSTMSTSIETFVITPRQNFTPMYEPFDFADAHCPPASLKSLNLWTVIGPDGHYNPIISPLKGLTNIDPAWNQNCFAAPFQGNDPPFALTPAKALTPVTTSAAPPEAITIPATPSNSPMILPPVTSMVSSSTPKVTNTLPNDPPASDPNRGSNEPASPAPIPVEPTNQSPNSPPKGSNLGANPESKGPAPLAPKSTVTLTSTFVSQGQVAIASTIATILGAVVTLPVGTTNAPGPSIPAIIVTYGGSTYTAIGGAGPDSKPTIGFVIGSQTLTPGGVITVSETPLILAAGPTSGNDGNSTIGGLIIAPFNGEARKLSLDVRLIPILVGIMWLLVL